MQLVDPRRRRLLRSARSLRAGAVHRGQPARGHGELDRRTEIAEQLERLAATAHRERGDVVRGRHGERVGAARALRRRARPRGRHAPVADVPRPGADPLQGANARAADAATRLPEFPGLRALQPGGGRRASRRPHGADGGALDKTTRASLAAFHKTHYVPDHAAIAITGDITMAAGAQGDPGAVRGVAEVGPPRAAGSRPGGARRPRRLPGRTAQLGANQPRRRRAGHSLYRSGLLRDDGAEQDHRRRPDRTAVPPPARREGLHLRRQLRSSTRGASAAPGLPARTCARK